MTSSRRLISAVPIRGNRALLVAADPYVPTAGDLAVLARLRTLGFTVSLVDEFSAGANSRHFQVVVLGPSSNRSPIGTKYDDALCGVVSVGPTSWPHSKLVAAGGFPSGAGSQTQFSVADPAHALVAARGGVGPLSGVVTYAGTTSAMSYRSAVSLGAGSVKVAHQRADLTDRAVVIAHERGGLLQDGSTAAPSRRAWLGFSNDPTVWNDSGWLLVDNAVMWALGGVGHGEQITESNVGCAVAGGLLTTLPLSGGRYTVSTAGTTLDGVWIAGELVISADGCTIKNSRIQGPVTGNTSINPTFLIEDCDVGYNQDGTPTTVWRGSEGIRHHDYTARRVRVGGFTDALRCAGAVTVEDCFLRLFNQPGDHNDVSQNLNGLQDLTIRRCNMDARPINTVGYFGNACFQETSVDSGTQTFEDNLFAGGNFSINIPGAAVVPFVFKRNKFVRGSYQYGTHTIGGSVTVDWPSSGADVNVFSDNGETILR